MEDWNVKDYEKERKALVEDFINELNNEDIITLHNQYCMIQHNESDFVVLNNEVNFNEALGNMSPFEVAQYILQYSDYRINDNYFVQPDSGGIVSFNHYSDEGSRIYVSDILDNDVDDILDYLRAAGFYIRDLEYELDELQEDYEKFMAMKQFKEDWDKMLAKKMAIIELSNDLYFNLEYDEKREMLVAKGSNGEQIEVDIDYSGDLDANLQNVYEEITSRYSDYETE